MKKFLTLALCLASIGVAGAQKANVDQASKLSGKADQLANARKLIQEALNNPETKNDARTYFVAGKIEFDAFDNAFKTRMINPDDKSAKGDVMGDELLAGYEYFLKVLPLDSLPDSKGKVKPKYSKDVVNIVGGHANDFFNAGGDYYNLQKFYPKAYQAFIVYGSLPSTILKGEAAKLVPADQIGTSFYNAGLSAFQGQAYEQAASAFRSARLNNYDDPNPYIYEIACWQSIANADTARIDEAQKNIYEAALAGYRKYGLDNQLFINNVINAMVIDNKMDEAIAELNKVIDANPGNPSLLGLRGYVYDRAGNDDASEADYRNSASCEGVDFETLKNASKKVFRIGTKKWDAIEGTSAEAARARNAVKADYFDVAKKYASQAQALNADDSDLANLLESIDYVLETYFNN